MEPLTRNEMLAAVDSGFALLDINRPGWPSEVNGNDFRMWSGHSCVLAQLYGHYGIGLRQLGLSETDAIKFGFTLPVASWSSWEHLMAWHRAWQDKIVTALVATAAEVD